MKQLIFILLLFPFISHSQCDVVLVLEGDGVFGGSVTVNSDNHNETYTTSGEKEFTVDSDFLTVTINSATLDDEFHLEFLELGKPMFTYTADGSENNFAIYVDNNWLSINGVCDAPTDLTSTKCHGDSNYNTLEEYNANCMCLTPVLPIEISNITVRKDNNYNRINVTTESIVGSQEMQLLKLRNGQWEIINIWDTSIDSYKSKVFTYLDKPENEVDHYRIKSIDKDGKTQLTNIITINNEFDNGVIILTKDFYKTPVNFSKA